VSDCERAWEFVHREECWGGAPSGVCRLVDRADDPGGMTIHGVARNFWPALWIHGPPRVEAAAELFRERFWKPCHCDELPWPLNLVVADWAYLSGEDNPALALQRLAGMPPRARDGDIGPATVAAVREWIARSAAEALLARRRREFVANPRAEANPGWFRRIERLALAVGLKED
jgi:lysozyme family protein